MSARGLAKASAFVATLTAVYASIGTFALATSRDNGFGRGSAVAGAALGVLGAALVVMSLRQMIRHRTSSEQALPGVVDRLDTMTIRGTTVLGVVIALVNVKQLGVFVAGVSQIVAADVSPVEAWLALLVFLAVFQVGMILTIGAYVFARPRATRALASCRRWIVRHMRVLSIVLGLVVGGWLLATAADLLFA